MRRLLKNAPPDKKERLEANLLVVLPVELTLNKSIKSAVEQQAPENQREQKPNDISGDCLWDGRLAFLRRFLVTKC